MIDRAVLPAVLPSRIYSRLLSLVMVLGLATLPAGAQNEPTPEQGDSAADSRWESSIAAFESADAEAKPAAGGVVFVGSSSIRGWKTLAEDFFFPQTQVVNRGFGGSQMIDSVRYAERIVIPYRPRAVAVYAGDNDIAAGKTPERVAEDFQKFVSVVHRELPDARIGFISIKPSLQRWEMWPAMSKANALVRQYAEDQPLVDYLDIATAMLGDDQRPRPELFVEDGLHMAPEGYAVWTSVIRPWVQAVADSHAGADTDTVPPATIVFQAGQDGYPVYRIPAMIRAANGDLLAFCEARQGGDASQIDLVVKRSSDQGRSWSGLQVVQKSDDYRHLYGDNPPPITLGNPAPVVDHLDPEHAGRIWLPFTLENDRVYVTFSDDHGVSWAPPRDITADVKKETWGWYATGPVHSIQVQAGPHRGRLVVPADHRLGTGGTDRGPLGAQAILSDDHGQSWRLGAVDETYDDGLNANETSVVELADGSLYFNTRDQNGEAPGTRGEAWSNDAGESFQSRDPNWAAFRPAPAILDPPVVQGALLKVGEDLIVFSAPDENGPSGKGRSDLRLRFSRDGAESWHDGPLLHVGPAAYSDLVELPEGAVGVLFEAGDAESNNPYASIRFLTVEPPQAAGG